MQSASRKPNLKRSGFRSSWTRERLRHRQEPHTPEIARPDPPHPADLAQREDQGLRERIEAALQERIHFEALLTELSTTFVNLPARDVDREIERWLRQIVEFLSIDQCRLVEFSPDGRRTTSLFSCVARGIHQPPLNITAQEFPQLFQQLVRGELLILSESELQHYSGKSGPESTDGSIEAEKAQLRQKGVRAYLSVPLQVGGTVLGAIGFGILRAAYPWSIALIQRLRLVGEILAQTLVRQRAEAAMQRYAEEQAALYAVTAAAASSLDPDILLHAALDALLPALQADAGWIMLVDPTREYLRLAAWHGLPATPPLQGHALALDRCPAYRTLSDRTDLLTKKLSDTRCACLPGSLFTGQVGCDCLAIPLRAGAALLPGILHIAWARPRDWEPNHHLLTVIGQQIGVALRNAQLYQAARQVDRLQTLNALSAAANTSLDLDIVLRRVIELTCWTLKAEEGSILMRDRRTDELTFAVTLRSQEKLTRQRLAPGQGIAGWAVQHNQTVWVNDVQQDPQWYSGVDAEIGFTTRSLICVPLVYHGEVIGALELLNKDPHTFHSEDVNLLEAVAAIAAAALENARLFTDTRLRAETLAALYEISLAVTGSLNPAVVIEKALLHIQKLFRAGAVKLYQKDLLTGRLRLAYRRVDPELRRFRTSPLEDRVVAWALDQRQPALSPDILTDSRFSPQNPPEIASNRARALMAVPLLTPEHAVGVIVVTHEQSNTYTPDDVRTLESIAALLTIALENARLYEDLKTSLHAREQAQAQLIQAEKLAALGRLAASLAHEINNPLQAIQGHLEMARLYSANYAGSRAVQECMEIANQEIERIATIVHRMREFYRPSRAPYALTDIHSLLENVLALSRKQLEHSHITVKCTWAPGLPALWTNADQLKQVFLNLILNAIDAMPQGGTLHLRTLLAGPPGDAGSALRIDFNDTGNGISPEVKAHLFEPFFTTRPGGTGLGLFISYSIIKAQGGEIVVESLSGLGTTFTILLPTNPETEAA